MEIITNYNVGIEYEKAGIAERILATGVDFLVMGGYILLTDRVLKSIGIHSDELMGISYFLLGMLPLMFYNLLFELLLNGQTPGKKLVGIKVMNTDGGRPKFSQYLLRWLMRPVELLWCLGGVAAWTILYNGNAQRIGDLAAGTNMVRSRNKANINDMLAIQQEEGYQPVFQQAALLSDRDFRTILELAEPARREMNFKLLKTLSEKVRETLKIETEMLHDDFLKTIVKDYYYFHGQ